MNPMEEIQKLIEVNRRISDLLTKEYEPDRITDLSEAYKTNLESILILTQMNARKSAATPPTFGSVQ